jgi:hypothetical protein
MGHVRRNFQHYHSNTAIRVFHVASAGLLGGGNINGVQLDRDCKNDVDVWFWTNPSERMIFELEQLAGGGDIREVQLTGHCKHSVVVCDNGDRDRQKEGVSKGAFTCCVYRDLDRGA